MRRLAVTVAGILSHYVGSVAALECSNNAVILGSDEPLDVTLLAAIHHRRLHRKLYPSWSQVTDAQTAVMVEDVRALQEKRRA